MRAVLVVLSMLVVWFFVWRSVRARFEKFEAHLRALESRLDRQDAEIAQSTAPPTAAKPPILAMTGPSMAPAASDRDLVEHLLNVVTGTSPRTAPTTSHDPDNESLETVIGSRWLLYVGVVAVIVGASYFIKLVLDNQWLDETARVAIGGLSGVLLAYSGMRFVRAGYPLYGQALSGGGIAIVYLSVYAAFDFYQLISQPPAFGLMCLATMWAAWLADRQRSQALALMAVGGGFATPFLVSSGRDAAVSLFTYDAILVAGTMYLARRREWPWLNLVSYAGTVLTLAAWASRYYTTDRFLTTEIFLTLFCGMFVHLAYESRRSTDTVAQQVRNILWSAPVLYYVGSLAVLYEHNVALLIYLIVLHVCGAVVARQCQAARIRVIFWVAVVAPLATWIAGHANPDWFVAGLAVVASVYTITLVSQFDVIIRVSRRLVDVDLGLLHANSLAAYGCAFMLIDAVRPVAAAPTALALALWQVVLATAIARRDRGDALHFVGLAFTFTSIAIAIQFEAAGAATGWAAEGATAVWLGLRERRGWLRVGGALLLAMAVVRLCVLQFAPASVGQFVLLNQRAAVGAFVIALLYGLARAYRQWLPSADTWLHPRALVLVAANAVTLLLLTSEISAFWELRDLVQPSSAQTGNNRLSREAMLSIAWGAYATALIVAGLQRRYAPIRYFAIVIFGITILKVFMVDLAALDRIYRVLSIVGLGVLLLMTSYLYQRARVRDSG